MAVSRSQFASYSSTVNNANNVVVPQRDGELAVAVPPVRLAVQWPARLNEH